ncbi:hypothetical protein RND81_14G207100 [Saponaria officinalis]|uniref:Ubiquitin-like protease family profile domain-containing protein n=1 Tax=Saponaria officinalis TaxID=3572 RepID=A0AAW1GTC3_SAPOF
MVTKSRYFMDVERFKIQTFAVGIDTLTGNFCDNGICLMRFMETYKGRCNFYTTGITNSAKGGVVGAIDRLKVFYCHSILTSEMNVMRSEVIRNARQLGSVDGDVSVDTVWMHVTYRGIRSLLAKQPVADMIVDMASIYATLGVQDVAYLPTTVRFLDVAKSQLSIGRQYVKLLYLPRDATALRKVFIPLFTPSPDHWYLCVVDRDKRTNYVLDLAGLRRHTKRLENAKQVVDNVAAVISQVPRYDILDDIGRYTYVPRQTNGYDCGMFVIKWVQALHDENLWTNKDYFENMDGFRQSIIVKLMTWEQNTLKVTT